MSKMAYHKIQSVFTFSNLNRVLWNIKGTSIYKNNRSYTLASRGSNNVCSLSNIYFAKNLPLKNGNIFKSEWNKLMLESNKKFICGSKVLMEKAQVSRKEQLKTAVKDYGSTVIIFHITISLASLGFFYLLVSSGIDMQQIMAYVGVKGDNLKLLGNTGTFVTAYAIHKVFAPVRISITLGSTPFIVRYLRNKGILKKPKT